jgi:hypothetical protein
LDLSWYKKGNGKCIPAPREWCIDVHYYQSFSLLWIGFAAASGKVIDVPIVTQKLLQQQGNQRAHTLEMMFTLDAGNHPNHPTGTMKEYQADWWTKDVPPHTSDILNMNNLPACLEFHRAQCNAYDGTEPGIHDGTSGTEDTNIANTNNGSIDSTISSVCLSYRRVAVQAQRDLRQLRIEIQAKEAKLENARRLTMRRASAFHRLFEAAIRKETSEQTPAQTPARTPAQIPAQIAAQTPALDPVPAQPTQDRRVLRNRTPKVPAPPGKAAVPRRLTNTELAEVLRNYAEAEHGRLSQHPSLKWTWGPSLEVADIKGMFRAADRNYEIPHTGYDESLQEGRLRGQYSFTASLPRSTGNVHSTVEDVSMQELSDADVPVHFQLFPLHNPYTSPLSGELPAGGDLPSPTGSEIALLLHKESDDEDSNGNTGNDGNDHSSNHGNDNTGNDSNDNADGNDIIKGNTDNENAGETSNIYVTHRQSSLPTGVTVLQRALRQAAISISSGTSSGGIAVQQAFELTSSVSSDTSAAAHLRQALGAESVTSSSDEAATNLRQFLAAEVSGSDDDSELLKALAGASSSSSPSSSDCATDLLRTLSAVNDSEGESLASLADDERDESHVVPMAREVSRRWTAADFQHIPNPDDCM